MSTQQPTSSPSLLTLPPSIRHEIYTYLLPPPDTELPLQPSRFSNKLKLHASHKPPIPISLLLTCRTLHTEAATYLYNTPLFSITAPKKDILKSYEAFHRTLKKHAREEIHLDFFSNSLGDGCVLMYTGSKPETVMKKRERGVPVSKEEFETRWDVERQQKRRRALRKCHGRWVCFACTFLVCSIGAMIGAVVYFTENGVIR